MIDAKLLIYELEGLELEYPEERSIAQLIGNISAFPKHTLVEDEAIEVSDYAQYVIHGGSLVMHANTDIILGNDADLMVLA